jgi:hypothetical protein
VKGERTEEKMKKKLVETERPMDGLWGTPFGLFVLFVCAKSFALYDYNNLIC